MLLVLEHKESFHHPVSQFILRQHAVNRRGYNLTRVPHNLVFQCAGRNAPGITGKGVIHLLFFLVPSNANLVAIDHHNKISPVVVRKEIRLMLPLKNDSCSRRHSSENEIIAIKKKIFSGRF